MHTPDSSIRSRIASKPYRILDTIIRAERVTIAFPVLQNIPMVRIEMGSSRLAIIAVVVPELPAINITALVTEIVEKAAAPVIGPVALRMDPDVSIAVRIAIGIVDLAGCLVAALCKHVALRNFRERLSIKGWCCSREVD